MGKWRYMIQLRKQQINLRIRLVTLQNQNIENLQNENELTLLNKNLRKSGNKTKIQIVKTGDWNSQ